ALGQELRQVDNLFCDFVHIVGGEIKTYIILGDAKIPSIGVMSLADRGLGLITLRNSATIPNIFNYFSTIKSFEAVSVVV
uniref:hypothetical protein n=1 Tax=uncultured Muribaculum sp. TaxID=1918613 RepID=UPI0026E52FA9